MNTHAKVADISRDAISPAEWQARVDLAAVYRLVAHYGWDDVIYNHSSMRVPGEPRHFLMKQHDLLYTEVTASNLVKVSMDEDLDERAGVNRPGFTLHGGVLSARDDVNCAVHVHTEIGMAIAGLKHGLRDGVAAGDALLPAHRLSRLRRHHRGLRRARAHQSRSRQEPRDDHAQSRPAHGRQERARGLRADEDLDRGRRHPVAHGGDRRRDDRDPAQRSARRPPRNTRPTTPAAAATTGRPICACSTRSIPVTGSKHMPVSNRVKERLARGETALCMATRLARTPEIAMIADACGFDAFFIDMEHSAITLDAAAAMCTAAVPVGIAPLVRVAGHAFHDATRLMDLGAMGIICPDVETGEQAQAFAAACRFPPLGARSVGGVGPLQGYRSTPLGEVNAQGNDATLLVAMLESPQGIANADAIAAVPGIDVLLIGSNDLCTRHGHSRRAEASEAARGLRSDDARLRQARQMPRHRRHPRRRGTCRRTGRARGAVRHCRVGYPVFDGRRAQRGRCIAEGGRRLSSLALRPARRLRP